MHIGKALRSIREEQNISKEQFCSDFEISLSTLDAWEQDADIPSEFIRSRIIEYYAQKGVSIKLPSKDEIKRNAQIDTVINAGLAGAQTEVVQRFGSAVKEHFVAYAGVDNETGENLAKGLKKIDRKSVV